MSEVNAVIADPSNAEQLRAWDGNEGAYWAANADRFDRGVAAYHEAFLAAANIGAAEHVLDIGCGTGQTTRDAARAAPAGSALGVDLSSQMIDRARRRAAQEGISNVRFEQADAQVYPFEPAVFDVAISRTGAMFFGDIVAAFSNIGRALRPAGRLTLLTWQPPRDNEWIREISTALAGDRDLPVPPPEAPGPFALAEPDRVCSVLTAAGFAEIELDGTSAEMWFGEDAQDGYQFVHGLMGWMLEGLDGAGRADALDNLRVNLAAHDTGHGVFYGSATWTIRAIRKEPG
jgi:SAM-dependent methyltransferase